MTRSHGLFGLLFAAGVSLGACTGPYSTTSDGESSSTGEECPVGGLGCECTTGKSCDPGLVCASNACVKLDDDTSTGDGTTEVDPTTGVAMTTTAGSDCDPDGAGDPDPACPSDQPYCVGGQCFACGGIDCGTVSPDKPLCDQATGLCATCLCDDAAPVCDPVAHSCSVCTAHSDCPDSACDLWTGACFPKDATLWVDGNHDNCDDAGPASATTPLCLPSIAFERIATADGDHHAVRVRPGSYSVQSPLRTPGGHVVAVVHATGEPGDPAVEITSASSSVLAIDPDGKLIVDAISLPKVGADAIVCTTAAARLDRLEISEATLHGITATDCELVLRRGVLFSNVVAGANLIGGSLRLENTYISKNGNPQTGEGGIYLENGAKLDAVYSTWVENRGQAGTPFAVACSDDPAKEKVAVRNSLAINLGYNTLCEDSTVEHTGWSTDAATGDNMAIALADIGTYLMADGGLPGVYRVIAGAGLDDLGAWEDGDPAIDFDGDVRPASDNAPDFAGADRVAR